MSAPSDTILAAGGLVERRGPGGATEIALVRRTRYRDRDGAAGDCVLPKGKLDPGEGLAEAAVREVREETGCRARVLGPSFAIEYAAGDRPKRATYFLMACEEEGPVTDPVEVGEVLWLPPARAVARLTYDSERDVVRRAYALPG